MVSGFHEKRRHGQRTGLNHTAAWLMIDLQPYMVVFVQNKQRIILHVNSPNSYLFI